MGIKLKQTIGQSHGSNMYSFLKTYVLRAILKLLTILQALISIGRLFHIIMPACHLINRLAGSDCYGIIREIRQGSQVSDLILCVVTVLIQPVQFNCTCCLIHSPFENTSTWKVPSSTPLKIMFHY